jgi:hypothetical protein
MYYRRKRIRHTDRMQARIRNFSLRGGGGGGGGSQEEHKFEDTFKKT